MLKRTLVLLMAGTLPVLAEPQFGFIGTGVFYFFVFITKAMDYLAVPILLYIGFIVIKKIMNQNKYGGFASLTNTLNNNSSIKP